MKQFFFIFLISINLYPQKIEFQYILKGKMMNEVTLYLIKDNDLIDVPILNDSIDIKNLNNQDELMVIHANEKFIFKLFNVNEIIYIHIYDDNRLFGNTVKNKFDEKMKLKYFFRKRYYLDFGIGTATVIRRLKKIHVKKYFF